MAKKVYFYNSRERDRVYNADSMTDWLSPFFTTGVFNNCFQVKANADMTVTVEGGHANIKGKTVKYDEPEIFTLETASGTLSRIDNVILRRDDTARDIYLVIQTGGFSTNPTPPPLVREGALYDLKLAEIKVSKGVIKIGQDEITDTRMNAGDCGWVMSTVKEIDFSQITAQFDGFFKKYETQILDEYGIYEDDIQALKAAAGGEYDSHIAMMHGFEAEAKADFQAWVKEVKNLLGEDQFTQIAFAIDNLEEGVKELGAKTGADIPLRADDPTTISEACAALNAKTGADIPVSQDDDTTVLAALESAKKTYVSGEKPPTSDNAGKYNLGDRWIYSDGTTLIGVPYVLTRRTANGLNWVQEFGTSNSLTMYKSETPASYWGTVWSDSSFVELHKMGKFVFIYGYLTNTTAITAGTSTTILMNILPSPYRDYFTAKTGAKIPTANILSSTSAQVPAANSFVVLNSWGTPDVILQTTTAIAANTNMQFAGWYVAKDF